MAEALEESFDFYSIGLDYILHDEASFLKLGCLFQLNSDPDAKLDEEATDSLLSKIADVENKLVFIEHKGTGGKRYVSSSAETPSYIAFDGVHFYVESHLGSGSFGNVYSVTNELGYSFVIKSILYKKDSDPLNTYRRISNIIKETIIQHLVFNKTRDYSCAFAPQIFRIGKSTETGEIFILMEKIKLDFHTYINSMSSIESLDDKIAVLFTEAYDMCEVLYQTLRFNHNDMLLTNIALGNDDEFKLIDFGFSSISLNNKNLFIENNFFKLKTGKYYFFNPIRNPHSDIINLFSAYYQNVILFIDGLDRLKNSSKVIHFLKNRIKIIHSAEVIDLTDKEDIYNKIHKTYEFLHPILKTIMKTKFNYFILKFLNSSRLNKPDYMDKFVSTYDANTECSPRISSGVPRRKRPTGGTRKFPTRRVRRTSKRPMWRI